QRLFAPVAVNARVMLWIGAMGLAVNLNVLAMLRRGEAHDMNVAAATLHVLGDMLGSVAAVIAACVILWTGSLPIDPLLSLLVGALIVRSAWALVRRSAHILMEGSPDWLDVAELRTTLESQIPAIRDVHHVHAWLVGPQQILLTMHASVTVGSDHFAVLRDAKAVLAQRFGITHATCTTGMRGCWARTRFCERCSRRSRWHPIIALCCAMRKPSSRSASASRTPRFSSKRKPARTNKARRRANNLSRKRTTPAHPC